LKWEEASDALELTDSTPFRIGDDATGDMTLYHNGSDSYITNKTGELKIATETSGIAVKIGHTTSEVTVNDNLTVTGDLTVSGTTTTINTAVTVSDAVVVNNAGSDVGVKVNSTSSGHIMQLQDNGSDVLVVADGGTTTGTFAGPLTGAVTGNASTATALATARTIGGVSFDGTGNINLPGVNATGNQATSGNAATATALATGRTIGMTGDVVWTSASFDGSGNVTGTATIQANSVTMGTDTTGDYVATVTAGTGLTSTGATSGESIAHSLSVDASQTQITSVGALNAGSITSGFGAIDTGSSNITTTGTASATTFVGALTGTASGNDVLGSAVSMAIALG
jgi:hypothetical protein